MLYQQTNFTERQVQPQVHQLNKQTNQHCHNSHLYVYDQTLYTTQTDRVGFNVPLDTLQVISETIFPTNPLTGTSKQNQSTTKL